MAKRFPRLIIISGRIFQRDVDVAALLGLSLNTWKSSIHIWRKQSFPKNIVILEYDDAEDEEIVKATCAKTLASAERLYKLKLSIIEDDYAAKIAALEKEHCILLMED